MDRTRTFALGMAMGASMAYLMDPDRGRKRRALLRDQLLHFGHDLEDAARAGTRHARNRAVGVAHEVRAQLTEADVDDRVLEERVRSAIGRAVSSPGAVDVTAESGRVTLHGAVAATEVQDLVQTARSVRGVKHVENLLDVEADATRTPDLQGSEEQGSNR